MADSERVTALLQKIDTLSIGEIGQLMERVDALHRKREREHRVALEFFRKKIKKDSPEDRLILGMLRNMYKS